jgi:hypothetical protein
MPDVTEATAEVGQMILHALQNTLGLGPEAAIAQAQAETGVTDAQVESADMGQVFDYMCGQPGLSPEVLNYLNTANENYNNYGNVSQGGSYNGGGGGGYSGGGGGGANAQIVQQVTSNYNYQEINDNHIDILGNVNGDIDIDQDNDDIDVTGDGNAVNSGDGDQNAATGAGSSAAQSDDGDATSNSGDGSVVAGDDVDLDHSAVGDGNTVIDNEDGNFATGGSTILDNENGTIDDSSLGFGEGNVQGDVYNETGAANILSDEEHDDGDLNDHGGDPFDGPIRTLDAPQASHAVIDEPAQHDAPAEHFAPQVEAEPQHVEAHDAPDDDVLDS